MSAAAHRRARTRPRGKTRPGRLARLDAFLLASERALLRRDDGLYAQACVVDVGVGESPFTTLECADALAAHGVPRTVLGVELDPQRWSHALRFARERVEFRLGGFDLPLAPSEPAIVVRVMNVLRGYPAAAVADAHAQLAEKLLPQGVVLEGSSSPDGGVLCAHVLRRTTQGTRREALLFSTDFSQGFAPRLFRDRLPCDLRRRAHDEPLADFFASWDAAFAATRSAKLKLPAALFAESARELATRVPGIDVNAEPLARGELRWSPASGIPCTRG